MPSLPRSHHSLRPLSPQRRRAGARSDARSARAAISGAEANRATAQSEWPKPFRWEEIDRVRINETEEESAELLPSIRTERAAGSSVATLIPDEWYAPKQGRDVTDEFITATPRGEVAQPATASACFHVHLRKNLFRDTSVFNLSEADAREQFVVPWLENRGVLIEGRSWSPAECKLTIYEGPRLSTQQRSFGQGWLNAVKHGEDVTAAMLEQPGRKGSRSSDRRRRGPCRRGTWQVGVADSLGSPAPYPVLVGDRRRCRNGGGRPCRRREAARGLVSRPSLPSSLARSFGYLSSSGVRNVEMSELGVQGSARRSAISSSVRCGTQPAHTRGRSSRTPRKCQRRLDTTRIPHSACSLATSASAPP